MATIDFNEAQLPAAKASRREHGTVAERSHQAKSLQMSRSQDRPRDQSLVPATTKKNRRWRSIPSKRPPACSIHESALNNLPCRSIRYLERLAGQRTTLHCYPIVTIQNPFDRTRQVAAATRAASY